MKGKNDRLGEGFANLLFGGVMKRFKYNRIALFSYVLVAALSLSAGADKMYELNNYVLIRAGSPAADIDVENYSVPSQADINGDGLLDLVVGEATNDSKGKVRFYRNIGTNDAPVYGGFVFAQTASGDLWVTRYSCLGIFPRMVDWDLDGDLDLLAGIGDGTVKIFLNVGSTTNPLFDAGTLLTADSTTLNVGIRATPSLVDWNNDGLRDLLVGEGDGYVNIFINSGTDSAPVYHAGQLVQAAGVTLDVGSRSSPDYADLDGDGLKDLLIGDGNGQLSLYRNIGTSSAPAFSTGSYVQVKGVSISLGQRSRPFVCDYNRDGRLDILVGEGVGKVYLFTSMSPFVLGGKRLVEVQNDDGGWDWPLDDGDPLTGSDSSSLGSVGLGLAYAYCRTGDPDMRTALQTAGQLLLQKTNDFYANEGTFAAALDSIFETTDYSTHVRTAFYDRLAAGTYYDTRTDTPNMTTAMYIQSKLDMYISQPNGAAWDLGLSLVDVAAVGADTTLWADAVKTAIEQMALGEKIDEDYINDYDVLGLAGALYGLAAAGIEFDPQVGPFTAAENLRDLGDILASWQLLSGGFTFNSAAREENVGNEFLQETAYAARALFAVDRDRFWTNIHNADAFIASNQMNTGGWENTAFFYSGEDNAVTGDALVALQTTGSKNGDLDYNGTVDLRDLAILSQNWGRTGCGFCDNADINGDHAVDLIDLLLMSENWMTN